MACHRREDDLYAALPFVIAAANASPPVEIIVVDYANPEPLVLDQFAENLNPPSTFVVVTYRGRRHYHTTHARNLSIRHSRGEYIVTAMCDICPKPGYFALLRQRIAETDAAFLLPWAGRHRRWPRTTMPGMIVCRRAELVEAGGFDERMEFYGGEDKELGQRLLRRGAANDVYHEAAELDMIPTPNPVRIANFRLPLDKAGMMRLSNQIRYENDQKGILVVNEGHDWGAGGERREA
ncbi:MAG TPA: galactosyltransferase-related protein [Planctomycetota bacterium]|nr:galactosyltransferase-related protein [Planctomycetota bacterium]